MATMTTKATDKEAEPLSDGLVVVGTLEGAALLGVAGVGVAEAGVGVADGVGVSCSAYVRLLVTDVASKLMGASFVTALSDTFKIAPLMARMVKDLSAFSATSLAYKALISIDAVPLLEIIAVTLPACSPYSSVNTTTMVTAVWT